MFFPNKSPGHLNMKTLQNKSVMINDKLSLFWHLIHLKNLSLLYLRFLPFLGWGCGEHYLLCHKQQKAKFAC